MHQVPLWQYSLSFFLRASLLLPLLLLSCLVAACAPTSGVFSGGNWQQSSVQQQDVRALEVNAKNPQQLYAGDTQGNIYATADGGQHWSKKSTIGTPPNLIHTLLFNISDTRLYAATQEGLYSSSNAGQSWSSVITPTSTLPNDEYTALAIDIHASNIVYAATMHHSVFMSADNGTRWSSIHDGLPLDAAITGITLDPDQHHLWAATSLGVYRADSRGTHWQALNTGFSSGIVINTVIPAAVGGGAQGIVYAGTNKGFFRSSDGGAHWTTNAEALMGVAIYSIVLDFRSTNASTLYVGTSVGAFRSDDSGQNWQGVATGLPRATAVYALMLGGSDYAQLVAAAAHGIYLFPGSTGSISPSRILIILIALLFFFLLFRFALSGRKKRSNLLKPERIIETTTPSPER